jgi:hypothetical protein
VFQGRDDRVSRDLDGHGAMLTLELGECRVDDGRFGAPWTFRGDHLMLLPISMDPADPLGRTFTAVRDS